MRKNRYVPLPTKIWFPTKDGHNDKKMYELFKLKFQKGDKTSTINYLIGVHRGDNLTPLIFFLVLQATMELL